MFYPIDHVAKQLASRTSIEKVTGTKLQYNDRTYDLHQCFKNPTVGSSQQCNKSYLFKFEHGFAIFNCGSFGASTFEIFNTTSFQKSQVNVQYTSGTFGNLIHDKRHGLMIQKPASTRLIDGANHIGAGYDLYKLGVLWGTVLLAREDALIVSDPKGQTRVINKGDECLMKSLGIAYYDEENI